MAVIGGDVLVDPEGTGPAGSSTSRPRLVQSGSDLDSAVLSELDRHAKILNHVSDQVSALARMRMPQPRSTPTVRESPKELFTRLVAEVFVVIVALGLTFVLDLGLSRSFPEFHQASSVPLVCNLIVSILVIRFAFICWEPLRDLAHWVYTSGRNFIVTRGARNEIDDLSISGR